MTAIGIVVVEPRASRRRCLASSLDRGRGMFVAGVGRTITDAVVGMRVPSYPDVLLMNLDNPAPVALREWAIIHGLFPGIRVVGLVEIGGDFVLLMALAAGVIGLQPISTSARILRRAIRRAAEGVSDFSPRFLRRLKRLLVSAEIEVLAELHEVIPKSSVWLGNNHSILLTERERQIVRLLGLGIRNLEIAGALHLSERTVRNAVSVVLMKLGCANRTQVALLAARLGVGG